MNVQGYFVDLGERVVFTAGEAFAASLISNASGITHMSTWESAGVAGIAAGIAVVKGALAGHVGDKNTAALLPAAAGGAAGAAVGGAVGTAVGDVVSSVGDAVGKILEDPNAGKGA
jgi:hypothetical protein